MDGLIVSNTTVSRPETLRSPQSLTSETGGLSGQPLKQLANDTLSDFYRLTKGKQQQRLPGDQLSLCLC